MRPGPRNLVTDVAGLLVGNAADLALRSGVTVLTADALAPDPDPGWDSRLYRPTGEIDPPRTLAHAALTAIPYFAWANRAPGPMQVWLRNR